MKLLSFYKVGIILLETQAVALLSTVYFQNRSRCFTICNTHKVVSKSSLRQSQALLITVHYSVEMDSVSESDKCRFQCLTRRDPKSLLFFAPFGRKSLIQFGIFSLHFCYVDHMYPSSLSNPFDKLDRDECILNLIARDERMLKLLGYPIPRTRWKISDFKTKTVEIAESVSDCAESCWLSTIWFFRY